MENLVINRGNPRRVEITVYSANGTQIELSKCESVQLVIWTNGRSRAPKDVSIIDNIIIAELSAHELDYLGEYSAQVKFFSEGVQTITERVYLFRVAKDFYKTLSGISENETFRIEISAPLVAYDKKLVADAEQATINANGQADYAKEQGDYAKEQGNTIDDKIDAKAIEMLPKSVTPEKLSDSTLQLINASGGGAITNLADEEDLTTSGNLLKFKDKAYAPSNFSGLGRKILRKNINATTGKNILTQAMLSQSNTIYEIQYDYDLNGATITVPEGCTLKFEGGSLSNGVVMLNKTKTKCIGVCFKKSCAIKGLSFDNILSLNNVDLHNGDIFDATRFAGGEAIILHGCDERLIINKLTRLSAVKINIENVYFDLQSNYGFETIHSDNVYLKRIFVSSSVEKSNNPCNAIKILGSDLVQNKSAVIEDCVVENCNGGGINIQRYLNATVKNCKVINTYAFRQSGAKDEEWDGISIWFTNNGNIIGNYVDNLSGDIHNIGRCGLLFEFSTGGRIENNIVVGGYDRGIHIEYCEVMPISISNNKINGCNCGFMTWNNSDNKIDVFDNYFTNKGLIGDNPNHKSLFTYIRALIESKGSVREQYVKNGINTTFKNNIVEYCCASAHDYTGVSNGTKTDIYSGESGIWMNFLNNKFFYTEQDRALWRGDFGVKSYYNSDRLINRAMIFNDNHLECYKWVTQGYSIVDINRNKIITIRNSIFMYKNDAIKESPFRRFNFTYNDIDSIEDVTSTEQIPNVGSSLTGNGISVGVISNNKMPAWRCHLYKLYTFIDDGFVFENNTFIAKLKHSAMLPKPENVCDDLTQLIRISNLKATNKIIYSDGTYDIYDCRGVRLTSTTRPVLTSYKFDIGYQFFDSSINQMILWNGTAWTNLDGTALASTFSTTNLK